MTHGVVSALHRQAGILGRDGYENFIQVDAPINPGNSGGPLVNVHGDVVGINTAIATQSGGFQGNRLRHPRQPGASHLLKRCATRGKIVRGWLGVGIVDVSKVPGEAKSSGYEGNTGALVQEVMRDTPSSGKLQPGDVIVSLNGKRIKDMDQFRESIGHGCPPGTEVTLGIFRDGKQEDVKVKLGQQPGGSSLAVASEGSSHKAAHQMGMRLLDLNSDLASKYGLTGQSGALVVQVNPSSPAAEAGIQPGDLITRVNGKAVTNATQAAEALSKADLKKGVRLNLANREGTKFAFIQPEK